MLSDFSWDMTGYIPKHAVNPHGDGIIPYAAERIFHIWGKYACALISCGPRTGKPARLSSSIMR